MLFDELKIDNDTLSSGDYENREGILRIFRSSLDDYKISENTTGSFSVTFIYEGQEILSKNVSLINSDLSYASEITLNYESIHIISNDEVYTITPSFAPETANVKDFSVGLYYNNLVYDFIPIEFDSQTGRVKANFLVNVIEDGDCYIVYSLKNGDVSARVDITVNVDYVAPSPDDTNCINYFALSPYDANTTIFKSNYSVNCVVISDTAPAKITYSYSSDSTGKTGVIEGNANFTTEGAGFSRQVNFAGNLWTFTFSYATPIKFNKITSFSLSEQILPAVIKHDETVYNSNTAGGGSIYVEVKNGTDVRSLIANIKCEYNSEQNLRAFDGVLRSYTNKNYYVPTGAASIEIYSQDGYRNVYGLTIVVADKYDLQNTLNYALEKNKRYFTFDSYNSSNLQAAIREALIVMNNPTASVASITNAVTDLVTAQGKLESASTAQNNLAYFLDDVKDIVLTNYTSESLTATNFSEYYQNAIDVFEKTAPTESEFEKCYNDISAAYENLVIDLQNLTVDFDSTLNILYGTINGLYYFIDEYSDGNSIACYKGETQIEYWLLPELDQSIGHKLYIFSGNDYENAIEVGIITNFGE